MAKPKTLGQLIAVERATRQEANTHGAALKNEMGRKEVTSGRVRTYKPVAESDNERADTVPPSYQDVRVRVQDTLKNLRKYLVPALDVVASKDRTNQDAQADVIVNGEVLLPGVAISHLLWLENYLQEIKAFFSAIPTLSLEKRWTWNEGAGIFESAPEITNRDMQKQVPVIIHEPTKEHKVEYVMVPDRVKIGEFTDVYQSGAFTPERKQELLDKCQTLLLAVKDAITRANQAPAQEVKEGDKIMDFLLA